LNPSIYKQAGGLQVEAAGLVHEAVESYYAIKYGLRTFASTHMDYVAQWYAGEYDEEAGNPASNILNGDPYHGAFRLTYQQWAQSNDFNNYNSEGSHMISGIAPESYFGFADGSFYAGSAADVPSAGLIPEQLDSPVANPGSFPPPPNL
jgi:hypothetical protein